MPAFGRALLTWVGGTLVASVVFGPATVVADAFSSWTAGPGGVLDNTYDGYIDQPSANATVSTGGFSRQWLVRRQDSRGLGWR